MDRLEEMLAFTKVVELKSFTAAADRLGISKSVISRRMTDLENRLGARLINRTTRRLGVTEVGQAFYARCQRILADIEEAEETITNLHAEPRGILRVNAPMSFGVKHLAPAIAAFLDRHPDIRIDMDLNDRLVDVIDEGYDLAVRISRLKDSTLIARKLAPCRFVVCASAGYLDRHGRPRTPEDLASHNCLIYTNGPGPEQWPFRPSGEGPVHIVRVSGNLRVNNGDILCEAAVNGLGVAVLPTFIAGDAISRGRLEVVLAGHAVTETSVYAVYPHNRHLSNKVRTFVDFLAERFGPTPYWDDYGSQATAT